MHNTDRLPILEHQADATVVEVLAPPHPQLPEYFYRTNERGLIEAIDKVTGRILCVQSSPQDLLKEKWQRLVRIDTPEGPVWLERGLNYDMIAKLQAIPYSKVLGDLICEKIVSGSSLNNACLDLNLKYSMVKGWEREHKEFAEALEAAKLDRADSFHDEAVDLARTKATTKDTIKTLQWAAGKGNKEKYGTKEVEGQNIGNVTIIVGTGIVRPGDAGYSATAKDVTPIAASTELTTGPAEEVAEYTGGTKDE